MSELFEKSIRTLELPAVLEKLAAKAVSQAAKDRCLKLTPSTDAEEVLRLLDETDAAKERLGLHGSPSFSGVKDVSAALTRAAYLPAESRNLWGRLFGGSPRNFVAALAETDTLTDADIDELAEYLEELKKERK